MCAGKGGVVGVVGADHLVGIQQLWQSDSWRALNDAAKAGSKGAGNAPADASSQLSIHEHAGVYRALLESVLRLKSVPGDRFPPASGPSTCWRTLVPQSMDVASCLTEANSRRLSLCS